jgi:hypothetical protein
MHKESQLLPSLHIALVEFFPFLTVTGIHNYDIDHPESRGRSRDLQYRQVAEQCPIGKH